MRVSIHNALPRSIDAALTLLALASALFWAGWTVLEWYRWHPQMPWRDLFVILDELIPRLQEDGGWRDWQFLLEPHYASHRIALPRLLVALDMMCFGGRNFPLYVSGWCGLLAILMVYARMARGYFRDDMFAWLFCCGILSTLLFAPAHLWNLVNPINTSWHLSMALGLLAFVPLIGLPGQPSAARWFLAYLLATLSALTTFAGVMVLLLLPFVAILGGRRTLLLTVTASLLLTFLYAQGLRSDAAIAAGWDAGDAAAAAGVREAAQAALEDNDVTRIASKTATLLTWPLSADRPTLSTLLFCLSLVPVGLGWLRFLATGPCAQKRYHPWLKLCLLLASLSLGLAVAVQFGRIIEQPNYAHGPSYERYNTIVAVYWSGIFGLLLGWLQRFSSRVRLIARSAVLSLVWLLIVPGGDYLEQEIESLETAARLYAGGESPVLRPEVNRKLLRFLPEYVYSFEPFFQPRQLTYTHAPDQLSPATEPRPCAFGQPDLVFSASDRQALADLTGSLRGLLNLLARDILLFDNGQFYARLNPEHQDKVTPWRLVSGTGTTWVGSVERVRVPPADLQVRVNLLGGAGFTCMLRAESWKNPVAVSMIATRIATDV